MYEELGVQEASQRLSEGWIYLDVRTPQEFEGGHPEGAVNVPFALIGPGGMMPNPAFTQVVSRLYDTDAKLLVGCASGGRSSRGCQMLAQVGFKHLVNVEGGYSGVRDGVGQVVVQGWADAGLATSTDTSVGGYEAVIARARG